MTVRPLRPAPRAPAAPAGSAAVDPGPRASRVAALLALFAVLAVAALALGQTWVPASEPLGSTADRVLVVGTGPVAFTDLHQGSTPRLDALVDGEGAVGAMSTRTVNRRSNLEEGYLSLGAGFRLRGDATSSIAYDAAELAALPDVGPEVAADDPGPVVAVGAAGAVERNDEQSVSSKPGALAAALHDDGRTVAVVGNADDVDPVTGVWSPRRPVALAAMGPGLTVDAGVVGREALLERDPDAPFGVVADVDAVTDAALRLLDDHDVVFVDPGDLARVERWESRAEDGELTDEQVAVAHAAALARTDAVLGRLVDQAGDGTLVVALSLDSGGPGFHLTPLVLTGSPVEPGTLVSPSTKREGVVAVTDLAPTILGALGIEVPEDFPGNPVRYDAGTVDLQHLEDLDRDTDFREQTYGDWVGWFITASAAIYAAAVIVLSVPRAPRWSRVAVRSAALASAAFPLATFAFRAIPGTFGTGGAGILLVVAIDLAIVAVASQLRATALRPVQAVTAASVAVVLLDASIGTPLHVNSWLGYSLHGGGRFYGIPNTTYGVLAAGVILLVASTVGHARRRQEALVFGALLLGLTILVDGAPSLGGDVGGIVSLVPVFGLLLLALLGRRIRWRTVLALGLGTAVLLGGAVAADLSRPEDSRTHLGRFADRVLEDGPGELVDTFVRKQQANLDILQGSTWVRMVLVATAFLLVVLLPRVRRERLAPKGSAARIGIVATVAGAVVGFLANDSGPVVIGLFAVYLLPFVLLPALADLDAAAAVGEPDAGTAPVPAGERT